MATPPPPLEDSSRSGISPGLSRLYTPSPPGMRGNPGGSQQASFRSISPSHLSDHPHSHHLPKTLVQIIVESGPKSVLREHLPSIVSAHFGSMEALSERDIAPALGMMAATQTQLALSQRANKLQITAPGGFPITAAMHEGWNWGEFVDTLNELASYQHVPPVDWIMVIASMDYPEFYLSDTKSIELIVKAFHRAIRHQGTPAEFPIRLFIGRVWENAPGQLSFLRNALQCSPELGIWNELSIIPTKSRRLLSQEEIDMNSSSTRNALLHLYHQPWNYIELLEITVHLLDNPTCYEDARALLELAAKQAPELLCLGLATLRVGWSTPVGDLLAKLTGGFMVGQPGASIVLPRLWRVAPSVIMGVMGEMHRRDPSCISRLLDIAQELKALGIILAEARSPTFVIDLAALASRREHLNLDKWLQETIRDRKEPFLRALVEYLIEHLTISHHPPSHQSQERRALIPPSSEALQLMMKTMAASVPLMSTECAERWTILLKRLNETPPSAPQQPCGQFPQSVRSYFETAAFDADVEAEANACYERIYAQEASVQDVLATMTRLRASSNPRDALIFQCMVHNLLDEFRFFSKYPEKELALTGVIFGQLLQTPGLLEGAPLFIALRMITESLLCHPSDSKLWRFGMTALAQCAHETVARRFPMFCKMLLGNIPNLASFPAVAERLRQGLGDEEVEEGLDALLVPYLEDLDVISHHQSQHHHQLNHSSSFISLGERASQTLSIELDNLPLEVRQWIAGEETNGNVPEVAERICFHLNNVVVSNVCEKAREIAAIIGESASPSSATAWLAFHIVTGRVMDTSAQSTLILFVRLVDALSGSLNVSIRNSSNFVNNGGNTDLSHKSSSGMSLLRWTLLVAVCQARELISTGASGGEVAAGSLASLRSLGMWIGMLTLSRQRPLLHTHIPIRELILEAHDGERLPLILPFACRVIEGVARAPPPRLLLPANPWLMGVLGLLVDLYHNAHPPLRLNLKFEIEGLFKTLGLQLGDVPVSKVLAAPRRSLDIWRGEEVALSTTTSAASHHQMIVASGASRTMDASVLAASAALSLTPSIARPFLCAVGEALSILPRSVSDVMVPGSPGVIGMLLLAWEATLRTIITAEEMERLRAIAATTAFHIVGTAIEDEGDRYCERVARSLAAHLAGAMLREPLAVAMARYVESFTQQLVPAEQLEDALMAEVVERMAVVGAALAAHLAASLVSQIQSAAVSAIRPSVSQPPNHPTTHLLNSNSTAAQQARSPAAAAWEVFGGWNSSPLPPSGYVEQALPPLLIADCIRIGAMLGMKPEGTYPSSLKPVEERGANRGHSQLLDEFDGLVREIASLSSTASAPASAYSAPTPLGSSQTNLRSLMKQVLVLALHSPQRDETCEAFAERLWNVYLMANGDNEKSEKAAPALVLLLDKLCELSSALSRQVAGWIMAIPMQAAWPSVAVVAALLEAGLVSVPAFDMALAAAISTFAIESSSASISAPPAISPIVQLASVAASQWAAALAAALVQQLGRLSLFNWEATLTAMKSCSERMAHPPALDAVVEEEQIAIIEGMMDEWLRLIDAVSSSDKTLASFVNQGIARGWFREASLLEIFFRTSLRWAALFLAESSETTFISPAVPFSSSSAGSSARYAALSRWIVFTVRLWPEPCAIPTQAVLPGISLLGMGRGELLGRIFACILRYLGSVSARSLAELFGSLLVEWHAAERITIDAELSSFFYRLFTENMIILRPTQHPRLAFAWLEILAHRFFLPVLMTAPEGSSAALALLLDALAFWTGAADISSSDASTSTFTPQASNSVSSEPLAVCCTAMTSGLLRIFLVLLHDFPEFLAANHWQLVGAMPGAAVQLRNLVLSAFPRQLKLLDPFTPSLKIEALTDCYQMPAALESCISRVAAELPSDVVEVVDSLLSDGALFAGRVEGLFDPPIDSAISRPAWVAHIVFLIIGRSAQASVQSDSTFAQHAALENSQGALLLSHLLAQQHEDEMRYLIIGGAVNELRFPSPLTLFASLLVRAWFAGDAATSVSSTAAPFHMLPPSTHNGLSSQVKEIVARVLLERLVVQRPHPWGLLITFVEIVRSPQYRFWQQPFTRTSPDIERLFESVSRSCMQEGQALPASV